MERIGIYGGTFDPVHLGHVRMAEEFRALCGLERVLFIPAASPPHKPDRAAPGADRLAMLRLALRDTPYLEVCDIELRRGGVSYTCETVRALKSQNPAAELYLLMGEDMFATVERWRDAAYILAETVLCAAARSPGGLALIKLQAKRLEAAGARCAVAELEPYPVSSTELRERIIAGETGICGLHPEVERYIKENRIYGETA